MSRLPPLRQRRPLGTSLKLLPVPDAVNDPAINDHQVCHCPAHHKVVLRFVVFGLYLFSGHVAQTDGFGNCFCHFHLLVNGSQSGENELQEHDGQRNARKTAAGTQVQHLAARLEFSMNLATERECRTWCS